MVYRGKSEEREGTSDEWNTSGNHCSVLCILPTKFRIDLDVPMNYINCSEMVARVSASLSMSSIVLYACIDT